MKFLWGFSPVRTQRVAILAGSFNPPTIAHMDLVRAACAHVEATVCVLPKVFPHKEYFGATLPQRADLLRLAGEGLGISLAVSERGLLIDIAREAREHFCATAELYFLCGADAAERIIHWDYGHPEFAREMLREFQLLVAPRGKQYVPPLELRDRVHPLRLPTERHEVSSTEVRERIRRGEPWEHLVPERIVELVREIYS